MTKIVLASECVIGQYADFHCESWVIKDGQWVWDEKAFDTPEESERWKEHVARNGGFFGIKDGTGI